MKHTIELNGKVSENVIDDERNLSVTKIGKDELDLLLIALSDKSVRVTVEFNDDGTLLT